MTSETPGMDEQPVESNGDTANTADITDATDTTNTTDTTDATATTDTTNVTDTIAPAPIDDDVPDHAHSERSISKAASVYSFAPGDDETYVSLNKDVGTRASWWRRVLLDSWVPEILALIASTACLIANALVLHFFQDKAAPVLPYNIPLNAVVATLAAASRSMLIFTVAAAISQLKWLWYLKSRKLQDMQIFDDASRGPWGSFTLLWSLRAKPLASLGAVVIILAVAVDPFVQLILAYPTREIVDPNLTPPALVGALTFNTALPSAGFGSALKRGVTLDHQQFYPQPSCPTSDCLWPKFHSIGWCSKCKDVRSATAITDCSLEMLLNNSNNAGSTGCYVSVGQGVTYPMYTGLEDVPEPRAGGQLVPAARIAQEVVWVLHSHPHHNDANNTFWTHETNRSTEFLGVENPVIAFAHTKISWTPRANNKQSFHPVIEQAKKCVFTLCDQEYQVSARNGTVEAKVIAENYGSIKTYFLGSTDPYWISCWQERNQTMQIPYDITGSSSSIFCPASLGIHRENKKIYHIKSFAATIASHIVGAGMIDISFAEPRMSNMSVQEIAPPKFTSDIAKYVSKHGLGGTLNGIAASLSRFSIDRSKHHGYRLVHGTALVPQTYVRVAWFWLVYPFALNLFGIIFLLLAMIQSRRKRVRPWKASVLPLLYHGLEVAALNDHQAQEDVSAMAKIADETEVQFLYLPEGNKTTLKLV